MIDEKLTVKMVAEEFNIHEKTVYKWFERGLQFIKIGRMTRIKRSDLEEFISNGKA